MSTVPETGLPNGPTPGGLTAVSSVPETNVTPAAGVVPKSTVEPLVKPLPVIVTTVPPVAGPVAWEMPVTAGTAGGGGGGVVGGGGGVVGGGGGCVLGVPVPVSVTSCGCGLPA